MTGTAIERIVVQVTPEEKKAIIAKAKKLGLPVSELMRRGANAYQAESNADAELGAVADAALSAANRASQAIDDVLTFFHASEQRIAAMEAKPAKSKKRNGRYRARMGRANRDDQAGGRGGPSGRDNQNPTAQDRKPYRTHSPARNDDRTLDARK